MFDNMKNRDLSSKSITSDTCLHIFIFWSHCEEWRNLDMPRKRTFNEIKEIVNNLGYELLDEYKSSDGRKVIIRDNHGYKYDVQLHHLIREGLVPYFVSSDNPFALENISVWLKINNRHIELCDDNVYVGNKQRLKFNCEKYDDIFYLSWHDLSSGVDCSLCAGQQVGKYNNLEYLRPMLAKQWIESEHNLTPNEVTEFSQEMVLWRCENFYNHTWEATVVSRTRKNGTSCPKCNESFGEKEISRILSKYNIDKVHQHNFIDCRDISKDIRGKLRFDFYLPSYNLCIEMQGEQHFFPIDFAGKGLKWAEENFKKGQIRDQIKRDYCKDNNICLLEIPYWERDNDNIENILVNYLNL